MSREYKKPKDNTNDLLSILDNKELLDKHIDFINTRKYTQLKLPSHVTSNVKLPDTFSLFREKYTQIFCRWVRLLMYCYCDSHECYRFFGQRDIKMCDEFLDCKKFCIWCLTNGLVYNPNSYIKYLIRKDKSGDYTLDNVRIVSEKQLHSTPDLSDAITNIILAKNYEDHHPESVTFMSAYARYYVHDFTMEDAISAKYRCFSSKMPISEDEISIGFQPRLFYKSVADEDSCTFGDFLSRLHATYLSKIPIRPYDLIRKDFSITAHVEKFGTKSYKQLWEEQADRKRSSEQNIQKYKYSKLEQRLLNNPSFKTMKSGSSNSSLEDIIKEL